MTGKNDQLTIFYRISDRGNPKKKLAHATKEYCLNNCLREFLQASERISIVADNVEEKTWKALAGLSEKEKKIDIERTSYGSWKGSFLHVIERALSELPDTRAVYFLEDDYLHKPGSHDILMEGLGIADYVTLYDHPAHYVSLEKERSRKVLGRKENTRVLLTRSSHWQLAVSTTHTFATTIGILRKDKKVWLWGTKQVSYHDHHAFVRLLRKSSRTLISPIPGRATHCLVDLLSPFTDWERV